MTGRKHESEYSVLDLILRSVPGNSILGEWIRQPGMGGCCAKPVDGLPSGNSKQPGCWIGWCSFVFPNLQCLKQRILHNILYLVDLPRTQEFGQHSGHPSRLMAEKMTD